MQVIRTTFRHTCSRCCKIIDINVEESIALKLKDNSDLSEEESRQVLANKELEKISTLQDFPWFYLVVDGKHINLCPSCYEKYLRMYDCWVYKNYDCYKIATLVYKHYSETRGGKE